MKKILLYLSLGSNIGDRKYNILRALECLDKAFKVPYSRLSSLIETDPWGFDCDEKFINAVVVYELDFPMVFDPEKAGESILDICKGIEADFGRISKDDSEHPLTVFTAEGHTPANTPAWATVKTLTGITVIAKS